LLYKRYDSFNHALKLSYLSIGKFVMEYLNKHHPGDMPLEEFECDDPQFPAGMFRFEKQMK